ncbi:uncharacterized protein [Chanodichthys erythropterus]|uniref:uncharacterized protein n=1 Tax=Chanodichthys erythropterus TaxID=933992 RepID=UPI00351EACF3
MIYGVSVFVKEGDSVTLNTGSKTNQQEKIKWYFNNIRIAQINGDLSCICTELQCNNGTERFKDRLKLDHQTGSLTIRDIRFTDSGEYELKIISDNNNDGIFNVSVCEDPAQEMDQIKRKSLKEGQSVTFYPGEIRKPNDVMTWYFNDTCIAEITGDQCKICTDEQCDERFRGRLQVTQTGSLTITNIRNTDSGNYTLEIISNKCSIIKSFNVPLIDLSHKQATAMPHVSQEQNKPKLDLI